MKFDKILRIAQFFSENEDIDTSNLTLVYELSTDDYELLDKDLYVRQHNTIKNYVKNSTIELTLGKVKFIFQERLV